MIGIIVLVKVPLSNLLLAENLQKESELERKNLNKRKGLSVLNGLNLRFITTALLVFSFILPFFLVRATTSCGAELERIEKAVEDNEIPAAETVPPTDVKTPIDVSTTLNRIDDTKKRKTVAHSFASSFGVLALVLCAFLGLVYATKLVMPKRCRKLSRSLEIIDSCFIDSKNELTTVLWGEKLILVAKSQGRCMALSEISNKEEVKRFLERNEAEVKESDSLRSKRLFGALTSLKMKES